MKNKVEFTIRNLNREKIFKEIIKVADISDVKFDEENIKFCVNKNKEKKVCKILQNKSASLKNKREKGFLNFIKKNILKLGIIIPIIIFIFILFFCNNFVFNVNIYGINLINKSEINNILNELGINGVCFKSNINTTTIENKILELNETSLVSCIIKGNTLVINIKEKVFNEEYENKGEFKPLIASCAGIIKELTVIQGTPKVVVGQTVKVGDVLVEPYVVDTSGNVLSVKPMATILADIFYNTITTVSENCIVFEDTENSFEIREMFAFGKPIYRDEYNVNYNFYRTETKEEIIGDGTIFPIKYVVTKFIEQKQVEYSNYYTLNKEQIMEECKQKTRQLTNECDIINDEYSQITFAGGVYQISYTVVVYGSLIKDI